MKYVFLKIMFLWCDVYREAEEHKHDCFEVCVLPQNVVLLITNLFYARPDKFDNFTKIQGLMDWLEMLKAELVPNVISVWEKGGSVRQVFPNILI